MTDSLYIHLPFCRSICPYCDFTKTLYQKTLAKSYIDKIIREIPDLLFHSIYIGGGTPSCLDLIDLKLLLNHLRGKTTGEFTIECNVEDINSQLLELLKDHGVNRLSLGIQSFSDKVLLECGRKYSGAKAVKAINVIARYFDNYSIDLIYGLPLQTFKSWQADLLYLREIWVPHISIYALSIEENSIWGKQNKAPIDDDMYAEYYKMARQILENYQHYEISNFCLKGYQSQHNLVYWHYDNYLAIGASGSGKINNHRTTNCLSVHSYIAGCSLAEDLILDKEEQMFEYLMMGFRLSEGISLKRFKDIFAVDFCEKYAESIKKHHDQLDITKERISIKTEYWYISNSIIVDFL